MFAIHFLILLLIIYFGVRSGGIALGLLGGLGVGVYVFGFHMAPGNPPMDVMLIILAVVTVSAVMESAGGLNYLIQLAEKFLRKRPKYITIFGPLVAYTLTACVGTGHAVYPLFPIIYDIAYKKGIRPERPMVVSSIASQMGITASPVAAAAATVLTQAFNFNISLSVVDILKITIPATLIGVIVMSLYSLNVGKDLDKDLEFQEKMKDEAFREYVAIDHTLMNDKVTKEAKSSVFLFLIGVLVIVFIGVFKLSPTFDGKLVSMGIVVQMIMFIFGSIMLYAAKVKPADVLKSKIFMTGMGAVMAIFGIAWASNTVLMAHLPAMKTAFAASINAYPWLFAVAMAVISVFINSQAATLLFMMPIGFSLGLPVEFLIGTIPACYAYFFFLSYPSDLACMNFDRTGTVRMGKYFLNHSFMIPGLIGLVVSTVLGIAISKFLVVGAGLLN